MLLKYLISTIVIIAVITEESACLEINVNRHRTRKDIKALFDFFNSYETLPTQLSIPIENLCLSYYNKLTLASSKFIECAVNNSRPFHACQNCLKHYLEVKDVRMLIKNVSLVLTETVHGR
jgi:hypothetical protein